MNTYEVILNVGVLVESAIAHVKADRYEVSTSGALMFYKETEVDHIFDLIASYNIGVWVRCIKVGEDVQPERGGVCT